jgi:hypothetical protein
MYLLNMILVLICPIDWAQKICDNRVIESARALAVCSGECWLQSVGVGIGEYILQDLAFE